jgi:isocitrate lyase
LDHLDQEIRATAAYMAGKRFQGITRLYSARQVVEQQGTIANDYTVARNAAAEFYALLREQFAGKQSITTFGPYSPGQAVMIKRLGIKAIYLGGWATSAKGSITEDPGPDLASYPLSQVPDEAAAIVRALLTADKNQKYFRSRMSEEEHNNTPELDFRPFIIADADTGHGGDAHVRNLIRRFVEVGVTGYHIEDQRSGTKKCGHQGGKVLVSVDEQIKRLNAARLQLDVMRVPGIIVARTDAEAANLLDNNGDGRDHPFILGVTNLTIPDYRCCTLAVMKKFYDSGVRDINGHLLYDLSPTEYQSAYAWLERAGIATQIDAIIQTHKTGRQSLADLSLDAALDLFVETWEKDSGLTTLAEAVADRMQFHIEEGTEYPISVADWLAFAHTASFQSAWHKIAELGIKVNWDCERSRTPEGYYQVRGGVDYAIAKSLAVAPYADLLWMETKTADLKEAGEFAEAIHAVCPEQMLAYNLSPSFNWDTTGMSDEEMRQFPIELGRMGFVFNFITYGGHQIDGLAAEEFATALQQTGMLALAQLQRKFRLLESPYKTPQTHVGGPRVDAALAASSGHTATTKAMGKGSTQVQHLVQTEVPVKVLEGWLALWAKQYQYDGNIKVKLRPHKAGSELLELATLDANGDKISDVIFANILDRRGHNILSVRDQNTYNEDFRKKRFMTLSQLFLIHRYKINSVHYVSPSDDNKLQTEGMQRLGIFDKVSMEIGDIIVAGVNSNRIKELLSENQAKLKKLIAKE